MYTDASPNKLKLGGFFFADGHLVGALILYAQAPPLDSGWMLFAKPILFAA